MNRKRIEEFEDCPVIAAIKDEEGLKKCLHSDIQIVFVLYGDICNIGKIVGKLKAAGKTVIIHIDLIAGLSSKEIAVTVYQIRYPCRRYYFYQTRSHTGSKGGGTVCHYALFCH